MNEYEDYIEGQESLSRSIESCWEIADDYTIKDGYIIPLGGSYEYFPAGHPELPGEFAKLSGGSCDDVLKFIKQFGLLGYDTMFEDAEDIFIEENIRIHGDLIPWIFAHAAAVNLVMELYDAITNSKDLQQIFARFSVNKKGGLQIPHPFRRNSGSHYVNFYGSALEIAWCIIGSIINDNLINTSRHLYLNHEDGNVKLVSRFKFRNLLDCIYWILADTVIGGKVKTCEFCGKLFIADSDKNRYCPKSFDDTVSKCLNRARQQNFRDRNKGHKK